MTRTVSRPEFFMENSNCSLTLAQISFQKLVVKETDDVMEDVVEGDCGSEGGNKNS